MKRSKEEKAADRERFRRLSFAQKAEHIWIYYKWPILLGLVFLIIVGSAVNRRLHRKDSVLYLGLTNVVLSSELEGSVTAGFLENAGFDPKKAEVTLYKNLYLSEDAEGDAHRISYASKIRLFASLEGQKLDAVLMSRQAYDIMSQSGYLLPLPDFLSADPVLAKAAEPFITENAVILSDNNIEYLLNEEDERQTVTEDVPNALVLNALPLFGAFDEPVYLGFAGNTPRTEACLKYLSYLLSAADRK